MRLQIEELSEQNKRLEAQIQKQGYNKGKRGQDQDFRDDGQSQFGKYSEDVNSIDKRFFREAPMNFNLRSDMNKIEMQQIIFDLKEREQALLHMYNQTKEERDVSL